MQVFSFKSMVVAFAVSLSSAIAASALDAPDSFADLVEDISPSVVNITTTSSVPGGSAQQLQIPDELPDIFRDLLENNPQFSQPREAHSLGSGFIIDETGYIVTNNHVVDDATNIMVETYDHQQLKAELVGKDPKTDVALLKVETEENLPATTFGNSDEMRVGDWVVAIGNPLGQGFSVSAGVVSARNRALDGAYDDFIQTDAAINRGNSGGPLFNLDGDVIGMNTAILSPDGGSIGIGFAMSSRVVSKVVEQLKEFGSTKRGWLGVQIQELSPDIAEAMGLDKTEGVIVADVPDGPAKEAGIQQGDVILSFDGKKIESVNELVRTVGDSEVGKTVDVEVYRQDEDKPLKLEVTLGQLEEDTAVASKGDKPKSDSSAGDKILGMTLIPLDEENAEMYEIEIPGGLFVQAVEPGSVADSRALQAGDVIRSVNRMEINSVDEFNAAIDDAKKAGRDSVLLVVDRGGVGNFIALPFEE